jgi:hypothetical protein
LLDENIFFKLSLNVIVNIWRVSFALFNIFPKIKAVGGYMAHPIWLQASTGSLSSAVVNDVKDAYLEEFLKAVFCISSVLDVTATLFNVIGL